MKIITLHVVGGDPVLINPDSITCIRKSDLGPAGTIEICTSDGKSTFVTETQDKIADLLKDP
jgi:hypothetical protein